MMRAVQISAIAASFASLVSARAGGFVVPNVLVSGQDYIFTITSESADQVVTDVAMTFGISPAAGAMPGRLGFPVISTKILGFDLSNTLDNYTHYVTIPNTVYYTGPAVVTAVLFSIENNENNTHTPVTRYFSANVTVGETNYDSLVASTPYLLQGCSD